MGATRAMAFDVVEGNSTTRTKCPQRYTGKLQQSEGYLLTNIFCFKDSFVIL